MFKALDLFCCAGGASMGLNRAGFDVTGIDIHPQVRYPFRFIQADALRPPVDLASFDLVWASPHCQAHSRTKHMHTREYPNQIPAVREMLVQSGVHYVIENVPGAPLLNPLRLNGAMFGLPIYRERWFECSFFSLTPYVKHPRGLVKSGAFPCVAGNGGVDRWHSVDVWKRSMGIDWMVRRELAQAVPPAYAEWLGRQLAAYLGQRAAV